MYKYFSAAVLSMTALAADSERSKLDIEQRLSLSRGRNMPKDLFSIDKTKRSGSKSRDDKMQALELDLFERQARGEAVDIGLLDKRIGQINSMGRGPVRQMSDVGPIEKGLDLKMQRIKGRRMPIRSGMRMGSRGIVNPVAGRDMLAGVKGRSASSLKNRMSIIGARNKRPMRMRR